jgi:uncharacterized protein (DUF433 family)
MELSMTSTPLPLIKDANGIIRLGGTRVTLETVVAAFKNGSTCEEIVYQYPTLKLADVYAVISYYLSNQAEVETYLEERQKRAEMIRQKIESNFDSQGIRERLLKRRAKKNG